MPLKMYNGTKYSRYRRRNNKIISEYQIFNSLKMDVDFLTNLRKPTMIISNVSGVRNDGNLGIISKFVLIHRKLTPPCKMTRRAEMPMVGEKVPYFSFIFPLKKFISIFWAPRPRTINRR
jgi:hypothetical protein